MGQQLILLFKCVSLPRLPAAPIRLFYKLRTVAAPIYGDGDVSEGAVNEIWMIESLQEGFDKTDVTVQEADCKQNESHPHAHAWPSTA